MVRVVWVGGGLLAASMGCSALSLGAAQGQALIGRPLDVSIPLTLGDGDSVTDACATAQVFFADDAVSAAGVKTGVTSTQPALATVRVQTTVPVTETFARIELQVGCGQRITRSYVLLADLAPATPPPGLPALPVAAAKTVLPTAAAPAPASVAVVRTSGTEPTTAAIQTRAVKPAPAPSAPSRPKAQVQAQAEPANAPLKAVAAAPASQGARLTLDPLELVAAANQMQPSLRLSVDAPVESAEDADLAQRRQAARLLWKTLNESPEQLAASALKAEVTGAEASRIQAELAQAQQLAQAAQAQLLEEQDSRYTNPVFLGVLAALLAALAGLVVVLRRQRHDDGSQVSPPWWKSKAPLVQPAAEASREVARAGVFDQLKALLKPLQKVGAFAIGRRRTKETSSKQFEESSFSVSAAPHSVAPSFRLTRAPVEFAKSSMFEIGRSVATEELFDLQQQVEFFISLDQADQAIEVLQAHLNDSSDPSPLAYLDLLKLHHDLGQRKEYALLQLKFNKLFNGHAPDFDRYSTSDGGLERYGSAMTRIQALWPEPAVLQLIERSIFRTTPGEQTDVFDLEAYRELLLLYGIARELIDENWQGTEPPLQTPVQSNEAAQKSRFRATVSEPLPASLTSNNGHTAFGEEPAVSLFGTVNPDAAAPAASLAGVPSGPGWELDLDLSVADEEVSASLPAGSATDPAAVGETDRQTGGISTGAPKNGVALDLDFSDLGDTETFTIKKSGHAA